MNKLTIIFILILIISIPVSYYLTSSYYKSYIEIEKKIEYEKAINFAKERFSKVYPISENESTTILNGKVISIEKSQIIINISPIYPLDPINLDKRIINIDNNTKIYKLEKNNLNMVEEVKKYEEKIKEIVNNGGDIDLEIPSSYIKTELVISEIKSGDKITIFSESNIHFSKIITPISIEIN